MPNKSSDLLTILVSAGDLTDEQADEVLDIAEKRDIPPVEALMSSNLGLDERKIVQRICEILNYTYVDLLSAELEPQVVPLMTQQQCQLFQALPIRQEGSKLIVAVPFENYRKPGLKDDIRRITRIQFIEFHVAMKDDIYTMISRVFRVDKQLDEINKSATPNRPTRSPNALASVTGGGPANGGIPDELGEDSRVTKFVDLVISQALRDRASDIHFDPEADQIQVRYRIDGQLNNVSVAPASMSRNIVSRIKYLANLDISDVRSPQDGRIDLETGGAKVDLRVATLPTVLGEKVVMRVLDNSVAQRPLEAIGFGTDNLRRLREMLKRENGMVLVTGPTGSGKSTTLYAALNELSDPTKNVITVEDPVEFQLPHIAQIAVNNDAGLNFAKILRTVLRADPDIILVGEIRDHETAEIAMNASLTGHLVLSTLHTNDAASALTRLTELKIQPFLVGATLRGVVAQRLVRRLCDRCKQEWTPTDAELTTAGFDFDPDGERPVVYKAVGCSACNERGYIGRLALHEVLTVTDEMEEAIAHENAKSFDIEKIAVANGMVTMLQDGWEKVRQGQTTIEEVLRVVS